VTVAAPSSASAQATMLHPDLDVRTKTTGLVTPTTIAFIGPDDILVLEKNTGQVKHVVGGVVTGTVLDLGVNSASERGLLGIALHPNFPLNPGVYLYWSCRSATPPPTPFFPAERECLDSNMFLPDSSNVLEVPLLGQRVDRFVWTGSALVYEHNLIKLRSFQNDGGPFPPGQRDEGQPPAGNHDGGVIAFGPDGKLYMVVGDVGRRGWMQNLECGPVAECPGQFMQDDQFGGPEADDAHLTGVILRLNDDGSTPEDNPFFKTGEKIGGEVGANIQKIFSHGVRNSFGMAFDPFSGYLWDQQNADDAFDELNLVDPGMNGGWIQIMGPANRIEQFKSIEVNEFGRSLQQRRWPPDFIEETPGHAKAELFKLPGSHYSDPEFSWKYAVPPAAIGFAASGALGPEFTGDLFVGASTPATMGGYLFRFELNDGRRKFKFGDRRLRDEVADNRTKHDITESESLLIGTNFGVSTDIETGPNGNLFVVSLSHGTIYEIFRRP
jgi:glucose/arabinose dehydrogenase